jgi:hypothetical protein
MPHVQGLVNISFEARLFDDVNVISEHHMLRANHSVLLYIVLAWRGNLASFDYLVD